MEQAITQGDSARDRRARRYRRAAVGYPLAVALLFVAPGPVLVLAVFAVGVKVLEIPIVYMMRRRPLRRHLRKLSWRVSFLVLAGVLAAANFSVAEARLGRLVNAMHAYHEANGAYPRDLGALAPDYIERIPRATLWLTMNRFRWNREGMLTCVPVPPIGWIGHDFRTDSPAALD